MGGMSEFESTWDNFQAAWSNIPADQRTKLLRENLSRDCVYTDPNGIAHGYDEITERIKGTQEQFPGASFAGDTFATHHGQAISTWTMRNGAGNPIFLGKSYARFGEDGRLVQMTGFFEPVG